MDDTDHMTYKVIVEVHVPKDADYFPAIGEVVNALEHIPIDRPFEFRIISIKRSTVHE